MARQMGLLADPGVGESPGNAGGDGDAALEAELLLLLGGREAPKEGDPPPPPQQALAAVEALAQLCLRDPPEEEEEGEEDLENEEELLEPAGAGALLAELSERAELYRAALGNAERENGNGARLRRLQRGLKTLEQMLESVRSGKPIDEAEIPPPVALGKRGGAPGPPPPVSPEPPVQPPAPPQAPPAPDPCPDPCPDPGSVPALRVQLQELQKEALAAKRRGDTTVALEHFRAAKRLEAQLEVLGQGRVPPAPGESPIPTERVLVGSDCSLRADPQPEEPKAPLPRESPTRDPPDTSSAPPAPEAPRAPRDVREALEQRMERYRAAAAQAKDSGDARKARMHERIVKQYQAAIRAHSAGKAVDLSELPVPPGFPPIQGTEIPSEPSIAGMLEAALKLTGPEQEEEEEEEEEDTTVAKVQPSAPSAPPPKQPPPARNSQPAPRPAGKAQQQLEFLELRRRQLAQAALRAKRRNDLEGAKLLLRRAKGIEGLIGAARGGLPVDIAQVPEVPLDGAEFELGPGRGVSMPPEAAKTFLQLAGALRRQHQMCLTYSRQFAQLGNISETTRCEALAEECRRHMETLRREHNRGAPPPKPRYEQRTFSVVKMFPELSSSDLELGIDRGISLPVPAGVAAGDLDTFVRFEFPHPSAEEAQRDKTNVVKNTDCPEFRARFRLRLLRGHRGLRRLLSSRGIKFEVTQKGGLFRPERALGSAQLRLEGLEGACELREQLELLDGRRRTGGRLEVWVRIREPLGAQRQLEPRSERWLVLEPRAEAPVAVPKPAVVATKDGNNRSLPTLPSLNLLLFDRERLERKMVPFGRAGRPVPPELRQQHQDLLRRIQGLRTRLQGGDPHFRREYAEHLERHLRLYTEAARRLGTQGEREAAKEALYKRNLVESELQKLRG
ncbi:PREDICTED: coiled-coil and C2 domain-containing protein 1A [Sturnus vulgaris]|uniref:coiled-coil and C2 domain-containing protein 1A n=1 Tax=Sturnus vulgaris TaxID=9172 RepID=UPI00071A7746|nr:PREDICTED: coiled-coil and C2 domain-containing protein 1A [Sturnus vulgaris]